LEEPAQAAGHTAVKEGQHQHQQQLQYAQEQKELWIVQQNKQQQYATKEAAYSAQKASHRVDIGKQQQQQKRGFQQEQLLHKERDKSSNRQSTKRRSTSLSDYALVSGTLWNAKTARKWVLWAIPATVLWNDSSSSSSN
jgi:hypothetical protein